MIKAKSAGFSNLEMARIELLNAYYLISYFKTSTVGALAHNISRT